MRQTGEREADRNSMLKQKDRIALVKKDQRFRPHAREYCTEEEGESGGAVNAKEGGQQD